MGSNNTISPDIQSMTGFATARRNISGLETCCDIRSVNGRSLDIKLRLPSGLEALEVPLRKRLGERFARGNLQLTVNTTPSAGTASLAIDSALFRQLARQANQLSAETGLAPPTTDGLLGVRGLVTDETTLAVPTPDDADDIADLVNEAATALIKARTAEGAAMAALIAGHIDEIETLVANARAEPASHPDAIKQRLAEQIGKLLNDQSKASLDPARLNAEAALLATKADIEEEIGRLQAHVAAARDLLACGGVIGRKFDFLAQELNREANTLCSKSASAGLTAIGLALKTAIDQLREQVQNLQ